MRAAEFDALVELFEGPSAACSATFVPTASSSASQTFWAICASKIRTFREGAQGPGDPQAGGGKPSRRPVRAHGGGIRGSRGAPHDSRRPALSIVLSRAQGEGAQIRKCGTGPGATPGTIDRAEDDGPQSSHAVWNFATALYYKAGGLPWRPADLPEGVCFIGISFHHLKKRGGHLVYASVAQAFSSDHEPFCLERRHVATISGETANPI